MGVGQNESFPDRLGPPPDQKQLADMLDLAQRLSIGGTEVSTVWRDHGYQIPPLELGDIIGVSVSFLTNQGKIEEPKFPLAVVRIFSRNEDGLRESDYEIKGKEGELKIERHETLTTPEAEQKKAEELKNFKAATASFSPEQAKAVLGKISERLERRGQEREWEAKVGEAYVDSAEAGEVIETLTKLAAREGIHLPDQQ